MRKGFVCLGHAMCVFFLFKCGTFAFTGGYNFIRQFIRHAAAITLATVTNEPFDAQGNFTVGTHLGWNLERSATYTAAAHFYSRRYVLQRALPDFITIFTG